jgi:lysine-N-methylase
MERVSSPIANPFRPRYGAAFHCIGADCEDTCCQNWTVPVDKTTYEKYQQFPPGRLAQITQQYVDVNDANGPDALYARIQMTGSGACPFLSAEKLCDIQSEAGPDYLSATCSIYPRALNAVDTEIESSLNLSCPEAARQVLLDPFALQKQVEDATPFRKDQFARLAQAESSPLYKPYGYFHEVRSCLIRILTYRQLPLWHRLSLMGDFCQRLDAITAENELRAMPALLSECEAMLEHGSFPANVSAMVPQPAFQLDVILRLTDQRMRTEAQGIRFRETFQLFLQGIGYSTDSTPASDVQNFVQAESEYHRPFFARHPFILENYLLNHIFRTLFPFGREASAHHSPISILDEYLLLAAQYAWINGLLIGIAGRYRDEFGTAHVVKAVQAFARAVDHDIDQRKRMLDYVKSRSLTNATQMVALLKY